MAAFQHHQIRRGWEGFGSSQTWDGLIEMLEDLKKLPLDHPDVCRNPRFVINITLQWNMLTETFLSV